MGLNAVLTFVSTLLTGVGFIMPIPVLADNSKQFIKKDVLRLLLWAFVGENYDEAVHRKLADKVNGYYHKTAQVLMAAGLALDVFLFASGMQKSVMYRTWILLQCFYNVLFYYRMGDATDSDITGHFPVLKPKGYLYYPFVDERKDFTRNVRMEGRNELNNKGIQLEHQLRVELYSSAMTMLAWSVWALAMHHMSAGQLGMPYWLAAILSLFPTVMMGKNWGIARFLDALQRYAFMTTWRLPLKKMSSYPFFSSYELWTKAGKLPKPAYNLYNSWSPLLSGFMHKNVYEKLRGGKYKLTIGQSMAATTLLRAAMFMSTFIFLQTGFMGKDESVLDVKKNTLLLSSTLLTIGYLLHAHLLWRYEDHASFAKSVEFQGNPKAREIVFLWHKIGTAVADHFLFTTPLVYTTFQAVN